ncbi:uncharacterized protein A4U43_C04F28120 [Asparagus officinalis]|uniref:Uncharacterized protein n=1 Tax=Asparagus officinalis TaxID=4686 RepID=A0A5P1F4T2_ASPOF|nr:uncharacterized protein A4U43_C04F28120 [Asparagus officinalis]
MLREQGGCPGRLVAEDLDERPRRSRLKSPTWMRDPRLGKRRKVPTERPQSRPRLRGLGEDEDAADWVLRRRPLEKSPMSASTKSSRVTWFVMLSWNKNVLAHWRRSDLLSSNSKGMWRLANLMWGRSQGIPQGSISQAEGVGCLAVRDGGAGAND